MRTKPGDESSSPVDHPFVSVLLPLLRFQLRTERKPRLRDDTARTGIFLHADEPARQNRAVAAVLFPYFVAPMAPGLRGPLW